MTALRILLYMPFGLIPSQAVPSCISIFYRSLPCLHAKQVQLKLYELARKSFLSAAVFPSVSIYAVNISSPGSMSRRALATNRAVPSILKRPTLGTHEWLIYDATR
mmetsp:Transcript_26344/g.43163  ORF Transcript_26344/g.43163 Transcript_26344/m.43163 type:complete len:106 (+) Transcript_26344:295-612(+)